MRRVKALCTRSTSGLAGSAPGPFSSAPGDAGLGSAYAVNAAWNALTYVREPGLGLDVVSLGLIYDVRAENRIVVEMAATGLRGPARASLPGLAQTAVTEAVGGAPVEVRLVWDPPWSTAMIDQIAAAAAGLRIG